MKTGSPHFGQLGVNKVSLENILVDCFTTLLCIKCAQFYKYVQVFLPWTNLVSDVSHIDS